MQNKELKKRIVRLAVSFCACVVSIAVSMALSYAWVSKNLTVKNEGNTFSISPDLMNALANDNQYVFIDTEFNSLNKEPSHGYLPGTSDYYYIGLFNKSDKDITISELGLSKPVVWTTDCGVGLNNATTAFDEIPVDYEDELYYLGMYAQVYIAEINVYDAEIVQFEGSDSVQLGAVKYTVPNLSGAHSALLQYDPTVQETDKITLTTESFTIKNSQAALIKINVVFDNIDSNQNMFVGFGTQINQSTGAIGYGYCHREIYATFASSLLTDESGS